MTDAQEPMAARESLVLGSVFGGIQPSPHPTLVMLAGAPGAGAGRAIAQLRRAHRGELVPVSSEELQAFHPRYLDPGFRTSAVGQQDLSQATALWLQACIAHARTSRYSLLLDGAFRSPETALAVAQRFTDSGYQVHFVVVATRRDESLLSTSSRGLRRMQRRQASHIVTPAEHDRHIADVDALVAASAAGSAVDRLTVIGRRGQTILDADRADASAMPNASAAFRTASSEKMTALEATQWLSELRHMTDYARSLHTLPDAALESLIELHEIAIREVVPDLPVPPESEVVPIQLASLRSSLAALRQRADRHDSPDVAAPVVTPSTPGTSISR
ncbi:zeta toxin family protein [Microbacterium abyssi]|uniref:zeta toxin family protein n=1 Tax=Microbacterium abyssi TaxID=2782166 RepID=UPI0018890B4D|nr:zeta toxin family protein [Microbacterium sp. A18JL241]